MTLLEELMAKAEEATKTVNENLASTLRATSVTEIVKESLMEDEDEEAENADESPIEITDVDQDGEEFETDDSLESPEGGEDDVEDDGTEEPTEDDEEPIESPEIGDVLPAGGEEEVLDLLNASYEEVLKAIENAPDNAKVVIMKKPAFDVTIGGEEEPPMLPADTDEEPHMEPDADDMGDGAAPDGDADDPNYDDATDTMSGSTEESYGFNESKILKVKNQQLSLYEQKNQKLQEAVKILIEENAKLKERETLTIKAINEAKSTIDDLVMTNVNLMHVTRLFTENTVTKAEKDEIIKEFDQKVKTPSESKILFESWNKVLNLTRNADSPKIDKNALNETVVVKNTIKESVSFKSEKLEDKSDFMRLARYKS